MQKSYKNFGTGDKINFCFFCSNGITLAELFQSLKGRLIAKLTKNNSKNSELVFCFQYSVFYWDRVYLYTIRKSVIDFKIVISAPSQV